MDQQKWFEQIHLLYPNNFTRLVLLERVQVFQKKKKVETLKSSCHAAEHYYFVGVTHRYKLSVQCCGRSSGTIPIGLHLNYRKNVILPA